MKQEKETKKKIHLKSLKDKSINFLYIDLLNLLFVIFIFFPFSSNNLSLIHENYFSEITLKIKGNGTQSLILGPIPDKIYLNEKIINSTKNNRYVAIKITGEKEENNVRIVWKNFNGNLGNAFMNLINISEIDLSKLNTSVIDMANCFRSCTSLKKVNFSNLDTSQVKNMGHLFANCTTLTSINLSSFDTSNVNYMDNMFHNCISLTSLNLSNFDTSSVLNILNMFRNCTLLTSLNLSNFNISGDESISSMFIDCKNLEYLNIKNFNIEKEAKNSFIKNIIGNTTKDLVICINKDLKQNLDENLDKSEKSCVSFTCEDNWIQKRKKYSFDNSCVDTCKFFFENKCFDECPKGTISINNTCENYSYLAETNESTYQENNILIKTNILNNITDNKICEVKEFFLGKCKNNFENKEDKDIFKENILSSIKDGSLINLISSQAQNNNSHIIINEENEIYLISTLENQINMDNVTSINFSECEKILKEDPENNGELYTFRIDHSIEGYNIPIIEYVIFNENGTLLDLDNCNNIYSQYFIPVSINEDDLFKHDPSSDYLFL